MPGETEQSTRETSATGAPWRAHVLTTGSDDPPTRIGEYEVVETIGRGGFGLVLKGRHQHTRQLVAIKLALADRCTGDGLKRFEVEWRTLAELKSPNIARFRECGWCQGPQGRVPYFVMDLIARADGGAARDICEHARARGFSLDQRMEMMVCVCEAVHHAHTRGVIHRDLKPGNIPVDESVHAASIPGCLGVPTIVDFGLFHILGAPILRPDVATPDHEIAGTLRYMAPEQVSGDVGAIGAHTDVHALGLIAYELATGRFPYEIDGQAEGDAIRTIQNAPRRRAAEISTGVDGRLSDILAAATAADVGARTSTARELAHGLESWLASRKRRRHLAGVRFVLMLVAAVALSTVVAERGLSRLALDALDLGAPFERWMSRSPGPLVAKPLDDVRVLALDESFNDQARLDIITKGLGLERLSASEPGGLRPLYGYIARLAVERGGAASSALDISFQHLTPFDAAFEEQVWAVNEAARQKPVPAVVVGMPLTMFDGAGMPVSMSPAIARVCPFVGGMFGVFESERCWNMELVGQLDGKLTVPSLPAMLFAKCRPGSGTPSFSMGTQEAGGHIVLGPTVGVAPGADIPLPDLPIEEVILEPGDTSAGGPIEYVFSKFLFVLPDRRTLQAATIRMQDVVDAAMSGEEGNQRLRAWLQHKAVLIGDVRQRRLDGGDTDLKPTPDGREVPGVYAHAVCTQWLMDGRSIHFPSVPAAWALSLLLCAAGAGVSWLGLGWGVRKNRVCAGSLMAALGAALVGGVWITACVMAFQTRLWMVYPWTGLGGLVIAAMLGAAVVLVWHPAAIQRREKGDLA